MGTRGVLYDELHDALLAGGCPFCRIGGHAADRYLGALLHEGVTDVRGREAIRRALGFCRSHAWQLTRARASALSVAFIYQDVLLQLARNLEGGRGRRGDVWDQVASCPACSEEADATARSRSTLLDSIEDPEIERLYVEAGGLCLPHFRYALAGASGARVARLRELQLRAYEDVLAELAEFIRKNDHRYQSEPPGRERDAWLRAVALLVGEPDRAEP